MNPHQLAGIVRMIRLRRCCRELAWDETDESDSVEERISEATATFAKRIQSWVEEMNPLAGEASMFADILGAALSEVSWYEIAGNWLEDVEKPEPETEEEEEEETKS